MKWNVMKYTNGISDRKSVQGCSVCCSAISVVFSAFGFVLIYQPLFFFFNGCAMLRWFLPIFCVCLEFCLFCVCLVLVCALCNWCIYEKSYEDECLYVWRWGWGKLVELRWWQMSLQFISILLYTRLIFLDQIISSFDCSLNHLYMHYYLLICADMRRTKKMKKSGI